MTILMCAQKLTDASLIYRTGPKTKTSKMEKLKNKRICSEETVLGKKPWSQSVYLSEHADISIISRLVSASVCNMSDSLI